MTTCKRVWQLDVHGFLIGPTVADESPLEPGVFLLPAGTVEADPPPALAAGHEHRWVDGDWAQVPARPRATPEAKLAEFLRQNPDVRALLDG